jgi:hypothetical protein
MNRPPTAVICGFLSLKLLSGCCRRLELVFSVVLAQIEVA